MTGRATNAMLLHGAAPRGRDQSRCPRGAPGLARAAPPQLDGTAFLCVRLWCYLPHYAHVPPICFPPHRSCRRAERGWPSYSAPGRCGPVQSGRESGVPALRPSGRRVPAARPRPGCYSRLTRLG